MKNGKFSDGGIVEQGLPLDQKDIRVADHDFAYFVGGMWLQTRTLMAGGCLL